VQKARLCAWFVLSVLLGLVVLVAVAGRSQAAPAIDIPGINVCSPTPPVADPPNVGMIGVIGERPSVVSPRLDPETVWSNGGFAGMYAAPYDLGCAADPSSYLNLAEAKGNSALTNTALGVGFMGTSLADSVDRRAWNPSWISTFLGDFADRATGLIEREVMVPFLFAGLAAASLIALWKFHDGNVAGAAKAFGWVVFVLTLSWILLIAPTWAASTAQSGSAGLVSVLSQGPNASDSATDRTAEAVHYQGWLRRTFGTENTAVATKYGPALLAAQRITWDEWRQVEGRPERLQALRAQKAESFKGIAEKVKAEDPGAYQWLTGAKDPSGIAMVEAAYAWAAAFFRLAADFLLLLSTLMLVVLCLAWLLGAPVLVTPTGQALGVGMLNASARAVGYVLQAAIGSWLFGLYLQACLQPGQSTWWSALLLIVGTILAWTLIRPDRKALALATMGRVNGTGKLVRLLTGLAMAYVGGKAAGKVVAGAVRRDVERDITPPPLPSEPVAAPAPIPTVVVGNVHEIRYEAAGLPGEAVIDGEVIYDSRDAAVVGPGAIYQRPEEPMPTPPPAGSVGEVEIYQRPPVAPSDADEDEQS
jgi:hypothetical protein